MDIVQFVGDGLKLVFVDHLPLTLVLLLGLAAIYLLLPRPRRYPVLLGSAAAGLAVLGTGLFLVQVAALTVETVLFYLFSAVAIVAGGLLVTQRNPARAAMSFALVILAVCGLFLLLAAPFLMAATMIVYAGAIIVIFLFVLMLAQQQGPSDADDRSREPFLSTATGFVLLGALLFLLRSNYLNETQRWGERATAEAAYLQELQTQDQPPTAAAVRGAAQSIAQLAREWKQALASTDPLVASLDAVLIQAETTTQVEDLPALEEALDRLRVQAQARAGTLRPPAGGDDSTALLLPIEELRKQQTAVREKSKQDIPPREVDLLLSESAEKVKAFEEEWQRKLKLAASQGQPIDDRLTPNLNAVVSSLKAQAEKARKREKVDLRQAEKELGEVHREAVAARRTLRLRFETLSAISGPPSSLPPGEIRRDAEGRPHLPGENAQYLGQSVFGDYLLAVELGGMLLLVATVGAIAIAARTRSSRPVQVVADAAPSGRST